MQYNLFTHIIGAVPRMVNVVVHSGHGQARRIFHVHHKLFHLVIRGGERMMLEDTKNALFEVERQQEQSLILLVAVERQTRRLVHDFEVMKSESV